MAQKYRLPFIASVGIELPPSTDNEGTGDAVIEVNGRQVGMRFIQNKHTSLVILVLKETDGYRAIRREDPG